jgi:N-acetyl-alpha-D-glucosaminyl L-malate synthase BshA
MVGEGPERQMAEDLARDLGIEEKVIFLGQSNEVDKILCFSDLFLLPSEKESFGLAALEAMMTGTPVVSSNTGGLPEVNKEGVSGFLCDVGDVEAMAEKGIHILKNESRLQTFKQNAKKLASDFSIEAIVPKYEELYETTVKEGKQVSKEPAEKVMGFQQK